MQQGTHKHPTPPWYRNAVSSSRPNPTSSIKPEVHNVSHIAMPPEDRAMADGHRGSAQKISWKIAPAVPEICLQTDRHKHRQTKLIAILHSLTGAE